MKKTMLLILFSLNIVNSFAQIRYGAFQNKARRFDIGVIGGNPNKVGLEAEYLIIKMFGISLEADVSFFPPVSKKANISESFCFSSISLNNYRCNRGNGFYYGIGYSLRFINSREEKITILGRTDGVSDYNYKISTFQAAAGYKIFINRIMLKPEIGIGVNSKKGDTERLINFPDGYTSQQPINNVYKVNKLEFLISLTVGTRL